MSGATDVADDGAYFVKSVSSLEIVLDAPPAFGFSGQLSDSSSILSLRTTVPINELNFEEVTIATGYKSKSIQEELKDCQKKIKINYIHNKKYG